MNRTQLAILWAGIALAIVMFLFPPRKEMQYWRGGEKRVFTGYRFLFRHGDIWVDLLLIQYGLLGLTTWAGIQTARRH